MGLFKKIFLTLNKQLFFYFILLIFLMIIGALFEMIGITLVVPVILNLLNSNSFQFEEYLIYFMDLFGFQNRDIVSLLSLILLFYIIKNLFLFFLIFANNYYIYLVHKQTAKKIFQSYLYQSYDKLIKQNIAILIRNATEEVYVYQNAINQLLYLLTELFVVVAIFTLIFIYQPEATLIVLIFTLILATLFIYLSNKYYKKWGKTRLYFSGISNKIVIESLKTFKEIRLYQKTKFFFDNFVNSIKNQAKMNMFLGIFSSAPRSWLETFGIVLLFSIVYFNINANKSIDEISELLVLFSFCAIRLLPSLNRIINHFTYLRYFTSSTELMFNEIYLSNLQDEDNKNDQINIIDDFNTSIILKNICFQYTDKETFNLKDINLKIDYNSFVGINGSSGSGKSTIIDILIGLLIPNTGKIIIDNKEITNGYKIANNWLSYVPQNVYLIDDSIKKNIALGVENNMIDNDRLKISIENSGLSEFVKSLHNGIDTKVGDAGVRLSGGQIQRVGIARALYNNPKLLILDESTSALDIHTENEILESIMKLKGKITVIIISHRQNTLKYCNKIFQIEKGKIKN